MESIFIKCRNFDGSTGLLLKVKTVKETRNKSVLNMRLHHVGLSRIIYSSRQMKYDIKENNNLYWLNKGPRYNTAQTLGLNSFITIMKLDKNGS